MFVPLISVRQCCTVKRPLACTAKQSCTVIVHAALWGAWQASGTPCPSWLALPLDVAQPQRHPQVSCLATTVYGASSQVIASRGTLSAKEEGGVLGDVEVGDINVSKGPTVLDGGGGRVTAWLLCCTQATHILMGIAACRGAPV